MTTVIRSITDLRYTSLSEYHVVVLRCDRFSDFMKLIYAKLRPLTSIRKVFHYLNLGFVHSGSKFPVFSMSYNPAENAVLLCTVSLYTRSAYLIILNTHSHTHSRTLTLVFFREPLIWRTARMICTQSLERATRRTLMVSTDFAHNAHTPLLTAVILRF